MNEHVFISDIIQQYNDEFESFNKDKENQTLEMQGQQTRDYEKLSLEMDEMIQERV